MTADDDVLSMGVATPFQTDDQMNTYEIVEIVDAAAHQLTQDQVEMYRHVKLVDDWL